MKRWLALPLARTGISPHAVSLMGVPLAAVSAWLVAREHGAWAFAAAVPAVLMDFLDGEVARLQGRETPFGNYFEAVVDRMVEGVLLVGLACRYPAAACAALVASFLVSYTKARAGLVVVCDNRDWPGLGDRSDRVVLLLLAVLFSGGRAGEAFLWLLASMALVGLLQRLRYARR
ncbi:MAG: CDP-alcohol phosphatidyltransferase family protein, partial [Candidatus Eremiobacterota bacterium]